MTPVDVPIPPGLFEEWCASLSRGTEMPPAAYLPTGVAVASAIIGPRLYIRWGPTRRERCNLWILNVGRSAIARKTTGTSAAKWATGVAAKRLGDQLRWYSAKRVSDAQLAAELDVVGADTAKAQAEEDQIAQAEKRAPRKIEPIHRRIPVAWLLAANEVAPLWGEGLRDWQAATQALLLDVFDGEIVSRTRSTAVAEQETFVSAIGNIPPAELVTRTTMGTLTSGRRGVYVHAGRVNSRRRFRYFAELDVDSADGTFLAFGPAKNLPRLRGWLAEEAGRLAQIRLELDLYRDRSSIDELVALEGI